MWIKAAKPVMQSMDKYIEEIASIWQTGIMTNNGEKLNKFKNMLKKYMDYQKLDLFVNGHSALMLAIKAMNLQGKVITSPFTFISTTNAIVQNGLTPVFGDIGSNYNLLPESVEELITADTCAIITPHIFGIPCDVEKIEEIAKKYHLKVIYDGAQAFGTKINGKAIGSYGDITMFSFHAIKVFNAIEGGMLTYKDDKLHEKFELYRNFGISYGKCQNDVEVIGINAKMCEFHAAMGIINLQILDDEICNRKKIAELYCEILKDIEGIETYKYEKNIDYNYAYFPIKILPEYGRTRDELWQHLLEKNIETRKLYNKLTYEYQIYKHKDYVRKADTANKIKQICLDLPIYGTLSPEEVNYICEEIRQYKR